MRDVAVLYLDLDSTVRKGYDELGRFVNGPEDVSVFPEAIAGMRAWKAKGGRVVGITNQGGIALGHVSDDRVQAGLQETWRQAPDFDAIGYCPHHPSAGDSGPCDCRKPATGLLTESLATLRVQHPDETYPDHLALFVGDRDEDHDCARNAGIAFEWAHTWRSTARRGG